MSLLWRRRGENTSCCTSLNVDAVSGATNTRNGILEAVKNCVEQAGGDVAALENAPGAQAKAAPSTTRELM